MATSYAPSTDAVARAPDQFRTPKPRTLWGDAWRQFRRHHLAMAGLVVFLFLVIACGVGPMLWGTSGDKINFLERNAGPSLKHPLGTNNLGQDMLSRILRGGRISLSVGIVAMLIAITLGTAVGALAGFFGGVVDTVLMRFTELLISLPQLPLLLLVIYLFRDKL